MAKEFPAPDNDDAPRRDVSVTDDTGAGFPASRSTPAPLVGPAVADSERLPGSAGEVKEAVQNVRAFWDRFGNIVLLVITVGVLMWAGVRFWNYRVAQQRQDALAALALARTPAGLEAVADEHDMGAIRPLALIRGGDRALHQAVSPAADADDQGEAADPAASLATAERLYAAALKSTDEPLLAWHAMAGLANVAETRRNFDAAAKHWQEAAQLAGQRYPYLTEQAQQRLTLLDRLKQPLVMGDDPATAPTPRPAPPPTTPVDDAAPPSQQ